MNSDPYLTALGLIGGRDLTEELLNEIVEALPKVMAVMKVELKEVDLLHIRKKLESTIGVRMTTGLGLNNNEQEPWLDDVKTEIKWRYWESYLEQLRSSGFSPDVLRVLEEDTHNILNECGNPQSESGWKIKGLVMGDVQSGKTASYCGLITKAADAGYRFIILLTGVLESLRSQTQERMDEGFVGRDSRSFFDGSVSAGRIGAGKFRNIFPNVLTSIDFDFVVANQRVLSGIPLENLKEQPVLLVMKKNRAALRNLISFLDGQQHGKEKLSIPMLLLDDEADNASVNASKDESPAAINKLIRTVIGKFEKSSYVAYTATPFANVFINPDEALDDLFPRNFIYSLNPPNNYIGVSNIFTEEGSHRHQLMEIDDAEEIFPEKHKKDWKVLALPPSLKEALRTFFLLCAIRDARGELLNHRSMLVNVTRFTDVQASLARLVKDYVITLQEEIRQYASHEEAWSKHILIRELHQTWQDQFSDCEFSWEDIRRALWDAVAPIKIVTVNQKSDETEKLNYGVYKTSKKGRRVVAIGGLTLSRGLTLEGLCVSYFYRNSKAYDTLLQMGRWFGYRPGYDDLCRIWMDEEVIEWFEHIADVVAELRLDIRRMHANRQPPSRFGIRVRSHSTALIVTALNKMRNAEEKRIPVSYSAAGAETPYFPKKPEENMINVQVATEFLNHRGKALSIGKRAYWKRVKKEEIARFLDALRISQMNMAFMRDLSGNRPLIDFIATNNIDALETWDVCLPFGRGVDIEGIRLVVGDEPEREAKCRERQFESTPSGSDYLKLNKQRLGEISDEKIGLLDEEIEKAENEWEEERKKSNRGATVPGYVYRRYRQRPLLTISFVQPIDSKTSGKTDTKKRVKMLAAAEVGINVAVGVSLSFPAFSGIHEEVSVPYRLNKVALKMLGLVEEGDEDEDQD